MAASIFAAALLAGFSLTTIVQGANPPKAAEIKGTKANCIDFNWAATGRKRKPFAAPGSWAGADPAAHVAWYKTLSTTHG